MKLNDILERQWENLELSFDNKILTVQLATKLERNGFNRDVILELTDLAVLVRRNPELNVILLCGRGDVFSEGSDPSDFDQRFSAPTLLEKRHDVMPGPDMVEAWQNIEAITIAAMDGRSRGAACVLSISCDFRIMGAGVEFHFPEVPHGMTLGWGTIPRLTDLVGPARCKQLVLFGDFTSAQQCLDWGLADEVAPAGKAKQVGRRWAERVAQMPALSVRMTKETVNAYASALHGLGATADRDRYLAAALSADFQESRAARREGRPPRFTGN